MPQLPGSDRSYSRESLRNHISNGGCRILHVADVLTDQQALITYEFVKWLSAHCPEHEMFVAECLACQSVPQCCPKHPMANGTYPGFDLACQDCMKTRPGYETVKVVGEKIMSAEEACRILGLPYIRRNSKFIRVPLNLLRKTR